MLPDHVVDTIRGLVEEGAYAKAAKHLLRQGKADINDPTVAEKLSPLHPLGFSLVWLLTLAIVNVFKGLASHSTTIICIPRGVPS